MSSRIIFCAPGNIYLAEEYNPLSFSVFHQGAVLETITTIENRPKITLNRFLDQDRGNIPAITATPEPGDRDTAPLDRWAITRPHFIFKTRRKDSRFASPVLQVLLFYASKKRMV